MRKSNAPRVIKPEQVDIGDTVRVVYNRRNGIVQTMEGVVHSRLDQGANRLMLTEEKARLFTWTPGKSSAFRIELLARNTPQETLI